MPASTLNLLLEQGATFSQTIAVGVSYAGYTARAKVRRASYLCAGGYAGFYGDVLVEFTCAAVTMGGDCVIGLTADQTALLLAPPWVTQDEREVLLGVWDLELVSGATVIRSRQGVVKLSREATYD
jgi:hypothetical protein